MLLCLWRGKRHGVSILVVLDDALVLILIIQRIYRLFVSILVVLDDALVLIDKALFKYDLVGLNPCCAGRCSSTDTKELDYLGNTGLNPCCAGRCSSTVEEKS